MATDQKKKPATGGAGDAPSAVKPSSLRGPMQDDVGPAIEMGLRTRQLFSSAETGAILAGDEEYALSLKKTALKLTGSPEGSDRKKGERLESVASGFLKWISEERERCGRGEAVTASQKQGEAGDAYGKINDIKTSWEAGGVRMGKQKLAEAIATLETICLHGSNNLLQLYESPEGPKPALSVDLLVQIAMELRLTKNRLFEQKWDEKDPGRKDKLSVAFKASEGLFQAAMDALSQVKEKSCNFYAREVCAFNFHYLAAKEVEFSLKPRGLAT